MIVAMSALLQYVSALLLLALQDPYTLKVDVPVVSVDVTVTDAAGSLVNDLGKTDFQLYEDGIQQEIRFFSPVSAPYNVFLLFDRSGSTAGNRAFMRTAVEKFLEYLRPQDRLALAAFDQDFDLAVPWTSDAARVIAGLERMNSRTSNGTRFYAALDRTLQREFRNVAGRRAVVVLTDGKDTDYLWGDGGLKRALKAIREQRIPIYIVALKDEADARVIFQSTREYLIESRELMQVLTDRSGGRLLFPKSLEDVAGMYEQIGRALGTSYSLAYISSSRAPAGKQRRIEVKTRAGGYRITQSRVGYTPQ